MADFVYFAANTQSLAEVFHQRALNSQTIYLNFREQNYSFEQVYRQALAYGSFFAECGLKVGDRVGLVFHNGPEFFYGFWGAVLAGAIAVPLAPNSDPQRLKSVIDDCKPRLVLYDPEIKGLDAIDSCINGQLAADWVADRPLPEVVPPHPAEALDLLFLQYTSGTTGQSKGVALSHGAVMANLAGLMDRMQVDPQKDSFSILVPMFHDMGLIGFGLGAVYAGVRLVLFRQDIRNIYRWLESFAVTGATISGCSNTILHLTVRAVLEPENYDLSNLRLMVVGSEPVVAQTVARFETTYHRPQITVPAYGLAEISLCATMTPPGEGYRLDEEGYVSCGLPLKEVALRIDGQGSGEIQIKSPSLMQGYFGRDSSESFTPDGFLKTGDLGHLDGDGYLYVCGRIKNLIIRDGRNLAPHELEEVAGSVKPVRLACVFGLPDPRDPVPGRELIFLVVEVPRILLGQTEKIAELYHQIYRQAAAHCRYRPDRIIFAAPASIPHSLNGKMQHQKMKELWLNGQFKQLFSTVTYPAEVD